MARRQSHEAERAAAAPLRRSRCLCELLPFHSSRGSCFGEIMGLLIAGREQFQREQQSRTRLWLGEKSTRALLAYNVLAIPPPCPHLPPSPLSFCWPFCHFSPLCSFFSFTPNLHFSFTVVSPLAFPFWRNHYDSLEPGDVSRLFFPPSTSLSLHFPIFFISPQKLESSNLSTSWNYIILLHSTSFHFLSLRWLVALHLGDTRRSEALRWPEPLERVHRSLILLYSIYLFDLIPLSQ